MTLVALLAVTTGAWAEETLLLTIESKDYKSFTSGSKTFDDKVTITFSSSVENDGDYNGWYSVGPSLLTVAGTNGYTITSCKFYTLNGTASTGYTVQGESPSVYLSGYQVYTDNSQSMSIGAKGVMKIEVYGTAPASTPVDIAWDGATKTGTFTQPAGNVTVSVEYYDLATLATNGVTAPTTYVWAKTEDPLAVVADGAVTGGTLMFAFGTETTYPDLDGDDWQTAIPTAENLDGAGGTYYVWFYIKGDDEHSDTEPQRLTLHVQPEPEYTVSMAEGTDDAANWKAGKNDATPAALPLEGVKKGDKVTVTYEGLRKVIGMKAEKIVKIKTFSIQGPTGNVSPGQTITFTIINIQPAEATNQTFEWKLESGAPEGTTIESISDDTKTVTVKAGSSMGPITIRATAKDGSGYSNTKQVWLIP